MRPLQRRSAPTIRTCCGASKPSPNFRRSGLDATQRLARLDRPVAKRELRRDGLNDASALSRSESVRQFARVDEHGASA